METIEQLKQAARERQEEAQAIIEQQEQDRIYKITRRYNSLTDYLRSTEPYSTLAANARMVVSDDKTTDVTVTFTLPDHADLLARFMWEKHFEKEQEPSWHHKGFDSERGFEYRYKVPDSEKLWGVSAFDRLEWEPEEEIYYARHSTSYFKDLGDALLAAERAFVDPLLIDDQLAEANALRAKRTPQAESAPEPTPDEILLDALKEWIRPLLADLVAEYQS